MSAEEIRAQIDQVAAARIAGGGLDEVVLLPRERYRRQAESWRQEADLWAQLDVGPFDRAVSYARFYAERTAEHWRGQAARSDPPDVALSRPQRGPGR